MKRVFTFELSTRVVFGQGCREDVVDIIARNQWKRIGLVVDCNLKTIGLVSALIARLESVCEKCVLGWCEVSEPAYDDLEVARKDFVDQGLQAIVGVGGGSALDMAKGMAVLAHNHKPAIAYRGFDRMTEPVLPIIAVPTTAGTGSEVTPNASFVDTREKRKLGINGEAVRPRYALLDPELTVSCPTRATVSAGVDSLVHATEAYVAKKTNPLARVFAREGFGRVFDALPRVVESPDDVSLRAEVMFGALLSGVALMHSGTGPAAAMSYPLGVHYGVPHGLAGAIFLPHVAHYNISQGVHDYADLYAVMDQVDRALPREGQARSFVERLHQVWERLRIPSDVSRFGLQQDGVESFVRETLQLRAALDQNPAPFNGAEIRATLRRLLTTSS